MTPAVPILARQPAPASTAGTDWLTIPEAAAMAGMKDPETLRRHIRAGTGPKCMAWGVGRKHRRVRREDMLVWLEGR